MDLDLAEKEYVSTGVTLKETSKKYGIDMKTLSEYSKAADWKNKRKAYRKKAKLPSSDPIRNAAGNLESIIEREFSAANGRSEEGNPAIKDLKELTNILKEAINIRRALDCPENGDAPPLILTLESGAECYGV